MSHSIAILDDGTDASMTGASIKYPVHIPVIVVEHTVEHVKQHALWDCTLSESHFLSPK